MIVYSQTSSTGAISTPMSNAIFNNVADNANEYVNLCCVIPLLLLIFLVLYQFDFDGN